MTPLSRTCRIALAVLLAAGACHAADPTPSAPPTSPGLRSDGQGGVSRDGKPFRGIGVNYFDLFGRTLRDPSATNHFRHLRTLANRGVPFVRFMAGGYWPNELGLWTTNRAEFHARLDRVVRAAETAGIGLIPSFCWHTATVPDLVGEPVGAWGDPASRTHAWMQDYVGEIVRRHRASPALWAWEFGNEYNLAADLPNAAEHRPPVVPSVGTPSSRSAKDELSHAAIRVAAREFARAVRRADPARLVLSGHAFPRKSAWHQMESRSWSADSRAQWISMLRDDNPDPVDSLSGRLYSEDDGSRLEWAMDASRVSGKPMVIGEFGVPGGDTPAHRAQFRAMLERMSRARVPLAALWVFDFAGQSKGWSVDPANDRAWQLDEILATNRRWIESAAEPGNGAASPDQASRNR